MANETIAVSDAAEFGLQAEAAPVKLEPAVDLGKIVYRGEKFFWRFGVLLVFMTTIIFVVGGGGGGLAAFLLCAAAVENVFTALGLF